MKLTLFEWIKSELKHVIYDFFLRFGNHFVNFHIFFYYFLNHMYCRYYFLSCRGLFRKNMGLTEIFLHHQWTAGSFK
jgi:hypothetical protein